MLPHLHQCTQLVLKHKAQQWKNVQEVHSFDVIHLHEAFNAELLRWLSQLQDGIRDWNHVRANLRNLQNIKEQLQETPWNYLPPKNTMARKAFIQDFLFYALVCQLLRLSCHYFQSFCEGREQPSKVYLLPVTQIADKKMESLLKPWFDQIDWLKAVFQQDELEYLCHYKRVLKLISNVPDNEPAKAVLRACLPVLNQMPDSSVEEQAGIDCMKQLCSAFHHYQDKQDWDSFRDLLAASIIASQGAAFTLDDYIHYLDGALGPQLDLNAEVLFWKQSNAHYKLKYKGHQNSLIIQFYVRMNKYLKKRIKQHQCLQVCKKHAHFDGTPMDFARYIYQFMQRQQFHINNSRQLKDVTRYFYDLIFVKHSKHNKRIDFQTIYSYVKRHSNGEFT